MDLLITSVLVILVIAEYFLCTKLKSPYWGGIIPFLSFVGTIFVFISGIVPLKIEAIFYFSIINIFFVCFWENGRNKYKNNKQAEIEQMKAKDL